MATIKKVYFTVPGGIVRGRDGREHKCTHIECEVGYSLGGMSYYDYHRYERGYYAYVKPVTVSDGCVGFTMFEGGKWLLVPCARQSPKRQADAVAKFDAEVRGYVAALYDTADINLDVVLAA